MSINAINMLLKKIIQFQVKRIKMEIEEHPTERWNTMSTDILEQIFEKVEQGSNESLWRVLAIEFGGVCRNWRKVAFDAVMPRNGTGWINSIWSLKQSEPSGVLIKCHLMRISKVEFCLYLRGDTFPGTERENKRRIKESKFLLAAFRHRRGARIVYDISLDKRGKHIIGDLRSNLLRSKFTLFDHEFSSVNLELALTTKFNTRRSEALRMKSCVLKDPHVILTPRIIDEGMLGQLDSLQITTTDEAEKLRLHKSLVGRFSMSYRSPLSTIQAFAICLAFLYEKP